MTRGSYNEYRGWTIPANENPTDEGYLVIYSDEYESWCPKVTFEKSNRVMDGTTFGRAVELAKRGHKIARKGWNGKGMFIVYQLGYPEGIPCNEQTAQAFKLEVGELFRVQPYLMMKAADGSHQMWTASQSDVLSEDWQCV